MTMDLGDRLARLSPQRRALLARRLGEWSPSAAPARQIPQQPRDGRSFPLSFAQDRLWFEHKLDPENPAYNEAIVLQVRGPLRLDWIEEALNDRVRRHESLRGAIIETGGEGRQVIEEACDVRLQSTDMAGCNRDEVDAAVRAMIRRPIRLDRPPLLRLAAYRLSKDEHILVFVVHHIVLDGWSAAALFQSIFAEYQARQKREPAPESAIATQYADFAVWERQRVEAGDRDGELAFWMRRLADAPPPPALPFDRPRGLTRNSAGGRVVLRCEGPLSTALRGLARRHATTLFTMLAAAFGLLLWRASGETDVVFAVPSTTRDLPELESAVGLFINTLVLRLPVEPDRSFVDYLAEVRQRVAEAQANRLYPYDKLIAQLRRGGDCGAATAVMFDLQRLPSGVAPEGLAVDYLDVDPGASKFELGLSIKDDGDLLVGTFEYAADLFDHETVAGLADTFKTLLSETVAHPDRPLRDLGLLSPEDERREIARGLGSVRDYGAPTSVQAAFDAVAVRIPDRLAVTSGEEALSYAELDRAANCLAYRLVGLGVVPGQPVAVALDRSVSLIVGIMAILKAGGAYVPLDPVWPAGRQADIIGESGARVLIAPAGHAAPPNVLLCDPFAEGGEGKTAPNVPVGPHDLAYVIYTSGSTGRPRGVKVTHAALHNLFHALRETVYAPFGDGPLRVAMNGPAAFDTSVKQFIQLLAGHTIDVVPDSVRADPSAFVEYLRARDIDVLDATPTHLAMLLAAGLTAPGFPSPRMVLVGGEAIDPALWSRLAASATTRFINVYGPTECTVDATAAEVAGTSATIGRPLPNVRTYVLDASGRPVPQGLPGELYIGGAGVSPGYHGDAALTAKRFVSLPFDPSPVYRTGDIVRRRHDGALAFLGRADGQIKLRGHRIERGDVAAGLKRTDGVDDAAVVLDGEGAQKRLVGYVVPSPARAPWAGDQPRHVLPNGLAVVHVNRNETDFLYEEMFERNAYGRHGIELRPGDVVFDVGANIGLFSLWAHHSCAGLKVHAFEPNPTVFARLETNLALYGVDARAHPVGLAAESGPSDFTAYPGFTILSGLHADPAAESAIVRSFVRRHQGSPGAFDAAGLDEIIEDRLGMRSTVVELDTMSAMMAREDIAQVDLLKINVEKSEAAVLAGIEAADWPKIRQVALEVHDIDGRLAAVTCLLEARGFAVAVEEDWRLEAGTATNFYVYARREERQGPAPAPTPIQPILTSEALHRALAARVPDVMVPAEIVLLDALPMTPNGKLDRARLPKPQPVAAVDAVLPRTGTETRLAATWRAVLQRQSIGVHEDFFRIGGHSLLATLLMAQIRADLGVTLPLRTLFEASTIARLAARIDQERPAEDDGSAALPAIEPDPSSWHEPFPLTPIQEAYWMGRNAAFELGAAATQIYLELEETGWDLPRVEAAWNRLIRRHDMLRAVILTEEAQRVLPEVPHYTIAVDDLRGLPPADVSRKLAARRDEMAGQTLQPDRWPLFAVKASLLDGNRVRLHVGVDALIADAASLFLLFDEWRRGYEGEDADPAPAIGFRDYVLAERRLEDSTLHRASRGYWFDRLDTLPPAPDLPVDRALAARSRPAFKRRSRRLAPALWDALKARAAEAGLTPSLVLIAAFAEILARWSADPRFTLNLTTFNRLPLHPDVTKLMGDFTTLTLLEVDHAAPARFEERARALQAQLWDDLEHRYVSGIAVLRALAQRRRSGASALMPVVFTSALDIDPAGRQSRRFGEVVESVSQTPQVWLDHQVMEWNGALVLNWDAVEAIFPDGFLDDLATAHGDLVERLAASPEAWTGPLGDLLPPWQVTQRAALNATAEAFAPERLEQAFLRHARHEPAAPAILSNRQTLTYDELAGRAQDIAARLQAQGQGSGPLVAIVMHKGWEQIAAALGILMAGAAYLPVDPDLPEERRHYLLSHCDVSIALTQSWVADTISWPEGVAQIAVDQLPAASGGAMPAEASRTDDLAYVLFTSGSTGVPKGVMIAHRAIVNTITDFARRYRLSPHDRTLALSSLSFDLSVFDIFGALSAGAAVVMPDHGRVRDPDHVARLARQHAVTVWQSVPALMQMMVEAVEGRPDDWPTSLRCIIMSGDWIPVPLPDRIRALAPEVEIHGQGGATETSINAVVYPIGAVDPAWRSIPYGKPFANQTAHVFDRGLEAAPVWVPGELYLGGAGLAEGYWKDAERTAAAFIRHPRTGERLYRTGDYGRFLPDGNIEFLGRRDNQVKINGYRIELGEIEAALARHPDIESVVVTAPTDAAGGRSLAAYVVPRKPDPDVGSDLGTEGVLLDPAERLAFKLDRRGLKPIEDDASVVSLPGGSFDADRGALWLGRQSIRRFASEVVSLTRISAWLGALQSMPVDGSSLPKLRYPSAGSLYPVQAYLVVKAGAVEGLAGGAYYYEPAGHRLVAVGPERDAAALYPRANRGLVQAAGFLVMLVGKRAAVEPLYGPLWRDFCLLEAGSISQLLSEAALGASLGVCPLGFLDEARARTMLGLDGADVVLHSLAGGPITPEQTVTWSPEEASHDGVTPEALRTWLGRKLPAYMVPARFVMLDQLPRTANGKIDREALPRPEIAASAERGGLPVTGLEKSVAAAAEAILGQGTLGLDANFFDLGANSMHLVQLHRRLQADLGRVFPLVDIFQNPSIRRLAAHLAGESEALPIDDIRERAERSRAERSRRLARRRESDDRSSEADHAR